VGSNCEKLCIVGVVKQITYTYPSNSPINSNLFTHDVRQDYNKYYE